MSRFMRRKLKRLLKAERPEFMPCPTCGGKGYKELSVHTRAQGVDLRKFHCKPCLGTGQLRYWPEWRFWGFTEAEAKGKREHHQLRWARHTKRGFESLDRWYRENPTAVTAGFPSPAKRRQYEAACRILVHHAIMESL